MAQLQKNDKWELEAIKASLLFVRKLELAGRNKVTRKSIYDNLIDKGLITKADKEGFKLSVAIMERVAYLSGGQYFNMQGKSGNARIELSPELDERHCIL